MRVSAARSPWLISDGRSPSGAQEPNPPSDNQAVTGSAFRFRLERVRAVRERKEKLAQRELADAISRRSSTVADLRTADADLEHARAEQRSVSAERGAVSATDLLARQAFLERVEAQRGVRARELAAARGGGRRARRRACERRQRARDAQPPVRAPPRRTRPRGRPVASCVDLDEIAVTRFRRSPA